MSQQIKRFFSVLLGVLILVLLFGKNEPQPAIAQSANYVWVDSIAVGSTVIDSLFQYRWEQVSIKFEGCDGWLKFGCPDTSSWSSRHYYKMNDGVPIEFGFATPLKRAAFRAFSTQTGYIYFIGVKKTPRTAY